MLTLPPARLSYVKSFGLAVGLSLSLLGLICRQLGIEPGFIFFAISSLVVTIVALRYPNIFYRPYRQYNSLARSVTHYCSIAVSGLCFFFILATVGREKAKIDLERPVRGALSWVARKPSPRDAYSSPFSLPLVGSGHDFLGWTMEFCSWGFKSKNFWVYGLLPFLGLLFLLDEGREVEFPADLYTLF
jgi:hypothetical protein